MSGDHGGVLRALGHDIDQRRLHPLGARQLQAIPGRRTVARAVEVGDQLIAQIMAETIGNRVDRDGPELGTEVAARPEIHRGEAARQPGRNQYQERRDGSAGQRERRAVRPRH